MNIELYIEDKPIELDESVNFAITRQFEDINNPTTIINDWSKTISIPFTAHNNQVFGNIYQPDRLIVDGEYSRMGIYFNPSKKLDFRLLYNQSVLMSGYAKMSSIKQSKGKGTYELNLFGSLGKLFQEMQKITFDTTSENTDHIIDPTKYVNTSITKDLVYSTWECFRQESEDIENVPATEIIGFGVNNAYNEEFDSASVQLHNNTARKFEDILEETPAFTANNVPASTLIGDGMLPRGYGEYRSYYQPPFIFFNKLFKIFQAKAEAITGYQFVLDDNWFKVHNPYWHDLVYMLKPLDIKDGNDCQNTYGLKGHWSASWSGSWEHNNWMLGSYFDLYTNDQINETVERMHDNKLYLQSGDLDVQNTSLTLKLSGKVGGESGAFEFHKQTGLWIQVKWVGANRHTESQTILVCRDDAEITPNDTPTFTINIPHNAYLIGDDYGWQFSVNLNPERLTQYVFGDYVTMEVVAHFVTAQNPMSGGGTATTATLSLVNGAASIDIKCNAKRSYINFTLNDLWNNEYNLFGEILKYCKIFNIIVVADDQHKQIKFMRKPTFFSSYTIKDWTSKLDTSQDYVIEPLTFSNKYLLFNYEEMDTKLNEKYKEKYDINYGELRLKTDYNFNGNTANLLDKTIKPSIMATDNVLDWNNLYAGNIKFTFANERYPDVKDQDNKYVANFGSYYFKNGLMAFDSGLRGVRITDDTSYQQSFSSFMYAEQIGNNSIDAYKYPLLDVVDQGNENLCLFNVPNECYTYGQSYGGLHSIYYNFWKKYLDERYSIQNKKVTCYLWLTPSDFMDFQFNHFVRLDNQLYMVNKISDYDITSNKPTKVELFTIQDIEAYTTDNYRYSYIYVDKPTITANIREDFTFTVYSSNGMVLNYIPQRFQLSPYSSNANEVVVTGRMVSDYGSPYIKVSTLDGKVYCQVYVQLPTNQQ